MREEDILRQSRFDCYSTVELVLPTKFIDKFNAEGWTDGDISRKFIYNLLPVELAGVGVDFTVESYADCAARYEELALAEGVDERFILDLSLRGVLEVVDGCVNLTD